MSDPNHHSDLIFELYHALREAIDLAKKVEYAQCYPPIKRWERVLDKARVAINRA